MIDITDELYQDIEAVRQISLIPTMLRVVTQTTGMGYAAVARVTNDRWVACSVHDEVNFGLGEGGELPIETTLCNEIRDHRQPIVIDNVAEDSQYCDHHTPKIYGLQSYISVPIILRNGAFFGTLCAIDARPAQVNTEKVVGTMTMFAELLSFHLESLELLQQSHTLNLDLRRQNKVLTNTNFDLDNFVYTAAHDLKSPVANIEGLLDVLEQVVHQDQIDKEEMDQVITLMRSSLGRFGGTIKDLTAIVRASQDYDEDPTEEIDLLEMISQVKEDLNHHLLESKGKIKVEVPHGRTLSFSRQNFKSILYNLISNALKYRSPERMPEVLVKLEQIDGRQHLSVTDNGLGIPEDKLDKVFTMFKRFHDHVEGSGLGLYIVKRLVENRNGEMRVRSTVNQGSTFTMVV
ncbi:ATP-binding protein [Rufibacter sp. LB8]|uniref:sensor histidine kinase n=1 Tax=Rufibacter sp. LB8 TaxID=2777781 RepID=UPI00178C72E9|nr:GAF domain-containing sensor histidine kinase [Rufibacter sp. LB8]